VNRVGRHLALAALLSALLAGPARGDGTVSPSPSLLPDVVARLYRLSLRYPVEEVYLDEERRLAAARVAGHWMWIEIEYDGQVTIFGLRACEVEAVARVIAGE
jgi:hypothetical protein